jgi:hypothetical protein
MKVSQIAGLMTLLAAFSIVGGQSQAGYIPLPSDMGTLTTPTNYTTVGTDTYTFSGYSSSSTIAGDAVLASSVHVSAVTTPSTGFELTGAFAAPGISQNDIDFAYTVSTTGPAMTSVSLNGNGAVTGGGIATITETVYTDATRTVLLGQLQVTTGTANLNLKGYYSSLYITEDILFNTYNNGDGASFSIIDQTVAVPEPSTIVMVGLGLMGVFAASRRRNRKVVLA